MRKILSILIVIVAVWGCTKKMAPATTTTTPTVVVTPVPEKPVDSVIAPIVTAETLGEATYNRKCGSCHDLKTTSDYTATHWVSIMQSMAPKARLNAEEKANVLAYVQANAKKG